MLTPFDPNKPVTQEDIDAFQKWYEEQFGPGGIPISTSQYDTYIVSVFVPRQLAVPAVPAVPATPAQIDYLLNVGWNTHARTINPVEKENSVAFEVNSAAHGIFLGLGVKNKDGDTVSTFNHGILVDGTGIWALERGAKVKRVKLSPDEGSTIKIFRQQDNKVVYFVTTGTETLLHVSSVPVQNTILYGYGYLYSSGDAIISPAFITGQVQFGRA